MPNFIETLRRAIILAQLAAHAHTGYGMVTFIDYFDNLSVDCQHICFLRCIAALLQLQGNFSEHFRRSVFTNVIEILTVICGLQTDK